MAEDIIKIKCKYGVNVIDSNGLTEHLVAFKILKSMIKKIEKWEEKCDSRKIEIEDDSGLHVSNNIYNCVKIISNDNYAIIEVERQ